MTAEQLIQFYSKRYNKLLLKYRRKKNNVYSSIKKISSRTWKKLYNYICKNQVSLLTTKLKEKKKFSHTLKKPYAVYKIPVAIDKYQVVPATCAIVGRKGIGWVSGLAVCEKNTILWRPKNPKKLSFWDICVFCHEIGHLMTEDKTPIKVIWLWPICIICYVLGLIPLVGKVFNSLLKSIVTIYVEHYGWLYGLKVFRTMYPWQTISYIVIWNRVRISFALFAIIFYHVLKPAI